MSDDDPEVVSPGEESDEDDNIEEVLTEEKEMGELGDDGFDTSVDERADRRYLSLTLLQPRQQMLIDGE